MSKKDSNSLAIFSAGNLDELTKCFKRLPPAYLCPQLKTTAQQNAWKKQRDEWQKVLQRIRYRWLRLTGLLPDDPFDTETWEHQFEREFFTAVGDHYFSIFQVINNGFEIIQEAAKQEGLKFPFANPLELFARVVKEDSISGIEGVALDSNDNFGKWKTELAYQGKLIRNRLGGADQEAALNILRDRGKAGEWAFFWLWAVWEKRGEDVLKTSWDGYLKSFKYFSALAQNPPSEVSINFYQWYNGRPYAPKARLN